jgi:hypothetical protein
MACPHYQEEPDRRPELHKLLKNGKALSGYAIDGGAATHFINGHLHSALQFYPDSFVFKVSENNGAVNEEQLEVVTL